MAQTGQHWRNFRVHPLVQPFRRPRLPERDPAEQFGSFPNFGVSRVEPLGPEQHADSGDLVCNLQPAFHLQAKAEDKL